MKPSLLILASVAATLPGCTPQGRPKPGEHAADGSLILHVFSQGRTKKPVPVTLVTDYGIMVLNDGSESSPKAGFNLASRQTDSLQSFTRLADFQAALLSLPPGTTVVHYDRCLGSSSSGLDFDWERMARVCNEHGIILTDAPFIACTCPD